jgi:hypothetical protein
MAEYGVVTTLDDFRMMPRDGRVILQMAVLPDEGVEFLKVGMTTQQARDMASHLIAFADRVDGERS